METEHGTIYKPAMRDFELVLQDVSESEAARLKSIWLYWESDTVEEEAHVEEEPHPDAIVV